MAYNPLQFLLLQMIALVGLYGFPVFNPLKFLLLQIGALPYMVLYLVYTY